MGLKLITPPEIEPVTLQEIHDHTRISHAVEDALLTSWIVSARQRAEDILNRAFIAQVWELTLDNFPCLPLILPRVPLMQLLSIKYYDTANAETELYYESYNPVTTTDEGGEEPATNANFFVDTDSEPGRLGFAYLKDWPSVILRPLAGVKIRFAAGYGLEAADVPQNVRDAILLYCGWRNENRAAEVGKEPEQFFNLLRHDRMSIKC
jgi:hypothetical protein